MPSAVVADRTRRTPVSALEFTGCVPARVTETEIMSPEWEGRRIEYWEAATETAWRAREPTSPYHERPAQRLAQLVERICEARGSGAQCFGAMDLRIREADGTLTDIMQADQSIILHPDRVRLPGLAHLIVGEHDLPDVVLEVDNTTDVRRGKLIAYREWGFPEVWVEVPEKASPSRPRRRPVRLVIHLLEGDEYRESDESRAFPTWRAAEIHQALNEPAMSLEPKRSFGAWDELSGNARGRAGRTMPSCGGWPASATPGALPKPPLRCCAGAASRRRRTGSRCRAPCFPGRGRGGRPARRERGRLSRKAGPPRGRRRPSVGEPPERPQTLPPRWR